MPYCLEDIQRIYRRLDVHFDHELGESFYHEQLPGVVEDLRRRGIARESQGAICVFLEGQPVPMIVRKQDGAFLYATTDLATIRYRMEQWRPDAILYVVDHRQSMHFQQLFAAARLLGYERVELEHVSFGTVLGKDGRPFKTRAGDTVGLEGLLDEAIARALGDRLRQRRRQAGRAGTLARAAGRRGRDGGHRGLEVCRPFAEPHQRLRVRLREDARHERQHGHVHAVRLRAGAEHLRQRRRGYRAAPRVPGRQLRWATPAERALAIELLRFGDALALAMVDYRPNQLTAYLFDLANSFSTFYEKCPVLKAETAELRDSRLLLCDLTARTIRKGLELLGIGVEEKM